jgi:hypothetical protein
MKNISTMIKELKENKNYERSTIDRFCFRGLSVLSQVVPDDFFDLEELPKDRFSKSGLFLDIPTVTGTDNMMSSNQVILAVVFKVEKNKSSCCPLRIDYQQEDEDSCKIYVYDQSKERDVKYLLFEYKINEGMFSVFEDLKELTLSKILDKLGIE